MGSQLFLSNEADGNEGVR